MHGESAFQWCIVLLGAGVLSTSAGQDLSLYKNTTRRSKGGVARYS